MKSLRNYLVLGNNKFKTLDKVIVAVRRTDRCQALASPQYGTFSCFEFLRDVQYHVPSRDVAPRHVMENHVLFRSVITKILERDASLGNSTSQHYLPVFEANYFDL